VTQKFLCRDSKIPYGVVCEKVEFLCTWAEIFDVLCGEVLSFKEQGLMLIDDGFELSEEIRLVFHGLGIKWICQELVCTWLREVCFQSTDDFEFTYVKGHYYWWTILRETRILRCLLWCQLPLLLTVLFHLLLEKGILIHHNIPPTRHELQLMLGPATDPSHLCLVSANLQRIPYLFREALELLSIC
jgi:hypothetical protein